MLLAQCCENDVVPFVLPFVEANIKDEMWQRRDAAVMAFGKLFGLLLLGMSLFLQNESDLIFTSFEVMNWCSCSV